MTLEDLVTRFRAYADDSVAPYFFAESLVIDWLNEAEQEAALRARLIHESADADICTIAVTVGTSVYSLHVSLYELTHIAFQEAGSTDWHRLKIVSTEWLDDNVSDWRTREDTPRYVVQDDKTIRLVPAPDLAGSLRLEGYRLPKTPMEVEEDEPEINKAHHIHLIHWPLHVAFNIPDSEKFDATRAARAEYEFTRYFGLRPDADLRRLSREDIPHHCQPDW